MARGRKPDTIPSVEWKLHIDGLVAAQVELLLTDPMRKKPRYGARSELTEQLYRDWISAQIRARKLDPGQLAVDAANKAFPQERPYGLSHTQPSPPDGEAGRDIPPRPAGQDDEGSGG